MKINYKPLKDKVIVLPVKAKEKTTSGLYIPETAQEKPQKGHVIAVSDVSELKVNSLVVYGKYAGTELEIDKVKYLLLKEDDILLTQEDE
jgi:chaperonin GroES